MGIYKPLNYDATMLIRLTTEMKDAFFAGCKARGVVPSEEARRLIVAQVLEQWGVDPNPKNQPLERCEDTLEMFPAVPADEVEKPPVRPPQRPPARKKRKDASFIALYNGQANACLFFALRYITKLYKCQKRQFCLGSITKCHVIRSSGGLQSRAKNKAPFEKLRLADFFHNGAMVCWSFVFGSWGRLQTPKTVCKGGLDKVTPALQVVIATYLLGEHKRVRNRMNSSKRFTVRYIGRLPLLA